jgi:hypothetical protein
VAAKKKPTPFEEVTLVGKNEYLCDEPDCMSFATHVVVQAGRHPLKVPFFTCPEHRRKA